jgi:hypothetical protein
MVIFALAHRQNLRKLSNEHAPKKIFLPKKNFKIMNLYDKSNNFLFQSPSPLPGEAL